MAQMDGNIMTASVDTAALRELLAKATPGGWCSQKGLVLQSSFAKLIAETGEDGDEMEEMYANARFIAAAHNLLPALLDELDALRKAAMDTKEPEK